MKKYWSSCHPVIYDLLAAALGLLAMGVLSMCTARPVAQPFVTGLDQPRGMAFDGDGNLFVAETGARATSAADGRSADTNHSGRVSRITPDGQRTTVVDGLPFTYYEVNGDIGVADVVFEGGALYALTGEGYDDQLSRRVLRVAPGEPPQVVASILSFAIGMSTSVEQAIGSVTSNPYAMAVRAGDHAFYVSDGASGRILRVTLDGKIRVFAEFPNMPPLAGLAVGPDQRLYVALFSLWPHTPGSGEIGAVDPAGERAIVLHDLTMPIDVGFDVSGAMVVLEFADGRQPEQPYAPHSGRLLRIAGNGERTVIDDRLHYPTAMAFSPAGDLYIAAGGAFTAAGEGAIVKIPCHALGEPEVCIRESAE
jgi:sugar lactone lactonase YvrE